MEERVIPEAVVGMGGIHELPMRGSKALYLLLDQVQQGGA